MDTNQFLIELQAILNKEVSKGNIDKSITRLQDQIKKLQLQAEIDPKALLKLKTKIEKVINQKITISNINLDTGHTVRNAQQTGQQIGNALNQGIENGINKASGKVNSEIQKLANQANKIQLSMETGGYESKVESLIAKTQQWTDANGNARISTTALSVALDNLGNASKALSNNNTVENQKALIAAEKELDTQIKKVTNSVRIMNTDLAKDTAVASLHSRVEEFMIKNGKAAKYFGNELKKILNETTQGAEVSKTKLAQLEQSFGNIGVAARNAGKLGKTFFQTLREGMSSFSYWTSSTFLVMKAIQSIKNGISSVKTLDTALVDLKKTTTMTNSELEDFYYSSNKVAKQMGVTTEEIINQASAWSRLN